VILDIGPGPEGGISSAAPASTRKPRLPNAMKIAKVHGKAFAVA
jgi:hypothetical protein